MKGKKQGLNGKSSLIMVKRLGKGVKPLDVRVAFENALDLVEERLAAVVCEKARVHGASGKAQVKVMSGAFPSSSVGPNSGALKSVGITGASLRLNAQCFNHFDPSLFEPSPIRSVKRACLVRVPSAAVVKKSFTTEAARNSFSLNSLSPCRF